jgi:hypothetical protein
VAVEEVAAKKQTLEQITNEIADIIVQRAEAGKNFGVVRSSFLYRYVRCQPLILFEPFWHCMYLTPESLYPY